MYVIFQGGALPVAELIEERAPLLLVDRETKSSDC